jgi:excisionase family DNA binding protein
MPSPTKPLGTQEIARMANVAPRTAAKWIDAGILRGYTIPGSRTRRCTRQDLLAFLQASRMPIPPELSAAEPPATDNGQLTTDQ